MSAPTIALTEVKVGNRIREDYGDLPDLMDSLLRYGQIQPIAIDQDKNLIAGGRRYFAHVALVESGHPQFNLIHYHTKTTLTEDDLREMELEENIRRKDMHWSEYLKGIYQIHTLRTRQAALQGETWDQRLTAISVGTSRQRVVQILPLARFIYQNPETPLRNEPSVEAAIRKLIEFRQREADALLVRTATSQGLSLSSVAVVGNAGPTQSTLSAAQETLQSVTPDQSVLVHGMDSNEAAENPAVEKQVMDVNLAEFVYSMDCRVLMRSMEPGSLDAIVTDPPFAIDMANLQQSNTGMDVSSTENEHQVDENLQLLKEFIPLAFRVLKDRGSMILFCDVMHFKFLHDLGIAAGFSVQRWPIEWCKTQAMNQASQYNFTKATEYALLMRKPGAVLVEHQPLNWRVISKTEVDKRFDHPFAKPRELWQWLVSSITQPGDLVADFFAGSGSGPCAFISKGRRVIACEKSEVHFIELLRNVSQDIATAYAALRTKTDIRYEPIQTNPK